jgi:uncharacterized small protein (DUF1192 family)
MVEMDYVLTIITALIGGGIVGFVQFLITRYDSKHDNNAEVIKAIKELDAKINALDDKIERVDKKGDERDAVAARVRILRFADDLRFAESQGRKFSKDSWDQCQSDITTYSQYCEENPGFKNHQTVATVEFIDKGYRERLETNNFL